MIEDYQKRDIEVCFVKIRSTHRTLLQHAGILETLIHEDHVFDSIAAAMDHLQLEHQPDGKHSPRGERHTHAHNHHHHHKNNSNTSTANNEPFPTYNISS